MGLPTILLAVCAASQSVVLDAGIFGARPAALEAGHVLGPAAGASWRTAGGFAFGGDLQLGFANANNLSYHLTHTEVRALGVVGYGLSIAEADLSVRVGAGAVFVHEDRTRHQAPRLEMLGFIEQSGSTGTAFGPTVAADITLRLYVLDAWGVMLRAGPTIAWVRLREDTPTRWGWSGGVAIVHRLGGAP